jgi:hypothetical protein
MVALKQWLRRYKHIAHLIAFLMIMVPSAMLYPAAQQQILDLIWALIMIIVIANFFIAGAD